MVDVAEKVLRCPARLGFPASIEGWPEDIATPAWTVVAGLAMYSARLHVKKDRTPSGPSFWSLFARK
jgi:cell division ATPase FtsA